jgi:hypothetical protein
MLYLFCSVYNLKIHRGIDPYCPGQHNADEEAINRRINYTTFIEDIYFTEINSD